MDRKPGELTKDYQSASQALIWIKVVGLGHVGVGKTCLIKHFCESKFTSGYQPTVGVDYGFKIQEVDGTELRVHLWDLSGNPEYLDVRNELYGTTDLAFLLYDVTDQATFDSLDSWLKELTKYGPSPPPQICLVANKIDMGEKRVVSVSDGKKWAAAHRVRYFETSCATGEGVEKLFQDMLTLVMEKRQSSSG